MVTITFEQVILLFIFALSGYILGKKKIVNSEHAGLLSKLEVYVFLPCMTFKTFAKEFTVNTIREKYSLILLSIVILALISLAAYFLAKWLSENAYEKKVYIYSLTIPNYGYMGYVLVEALFGSEMLLDMMIFALPVSIYVYTIGYILLTNAKFTPKMLLQPTVVMMGVGCLVGLSGVELPGIITEVTVKSSACVAPVSMILLGIVLSDFCLKELLLDKKYYLVSLLRLIILPCTIILLLKPFCAMEEIIIAGMLYAMPCGLNTIVFPKMVGENCKIGAGLACISSILACITIPICVELFTNII